MGGKKKGGGKKGGGKKEDEDDVSVDNFFKFYKKFCTELGCTPSPTIKEKYEEYCDEGTVISKVSIELDNRWRAVSSLG